ncbi:MAG: hypothetical protein LKE29_04080 [Acidaminococcaceae bacterium]|jgi:energy-coupling factor transporter ATP-binding protein EcfA2|nr:hypothetical protein [Acidaminococcaceae bacterium]
MANKEAITKHYEEVKSSLDEAVKESFNIKLDGEKENIMAKGVQNELSRINKDFKKEIDELQNDSEWDKLCVAFFGETNSGKSTLIDTLRIIYKEETRTESLRHNQEELKKAEKANINNYELVCKNIETYKQEMKAFLKQEKDIRYKQEKTIKELGEKNNLLGNNLREQKEKNNLLDNNIRGLKGKNNLLDSNIRELKGKNNTLDNNVETLKEQNQALNHIIIRNRNISIVLCMIIGILSFLIGKNI